MNFTVFFSTVPKRAVVSRNITQVSRICHSRSTYLISSRTNQILYVSNVDAEPLHRYQEGGYHPVALGDTLKNGRYKIVHKLGWGGYSTVWAARDQRDGTYVAIKISVSKSENDTEGREVEVMKKLTSIHPTPHHVMHMLDNYDLKGPNGTHKCLVLELLGPSVPDTIDTYFPDGRLPGKLAKGIARQALLGLDTLHQHNIGHGDLHTRNLAFTIPCRNDVLGDEFIERLGKPEIGHVLRSDGKALEPGVPKCIVRPASYQSFRWSAAQYIKIVDFGESFLRYNVPGVLHTPLPVRAPEIIFKEPLDYRVDLWSMGCMLFELFVGQPPFDSFLTTPRILVNQMQEMATDKLPVRWKESLEALNGESAAEPPGPSLQEWLEEMYFDGERNQDLTKQDIIQLGQIIGKLLLFEPSARASAKDILNDPWFEE